MKYIVVFGSPVSGLSFFGPFNTYAEALAYAEGFDDWWVAALSEPEQ